LRPNVREGAWRATQFFVHSPVVVLAGQQPVLQIGILNVQGSARLTVSHWGSGLSPTIGWTRYTNGTTPTRLFNGRKSLSKAQADSGSLCAFGTGRPDADGYHPGGFYGPGMNCGHESAPDKSCPAGGNSASRLFVFTNEV
jgi:hypothetical protein